MKKLLAAMLLGGVLTVVPALAQEAGNKPEAVENGAEKPSMVLWKWINFAILAGTLSWLISKNVGPLLAARSKQIQEGLAAGQKAKAEAEARAAAVEAKLANLGQIILQMKGSASEERDREAERIRRDTLAELARIQQHADQEIESTGKLVRFELRRFAAKLAIDLAEQKVRARMSPETQSALINRFIVEMADGSVAKAQTS